ncbi:transglutaminase domain-containing protein [Aminobacter sp. Piv2-1]|uniref:transglutaminase domain-containing protein n=1 Tax=Aminobacter sp. Piv2-1 TaxID=3031122 RepID=UPI0030A717FF
MNLDAYDEFLAGIGETPNRLAAIYHAVRNIPYGSVGTRDPLVVMKQRSGSCSGKHVLLRNLLRRAGYEAGVVTMFTYFDSKLSPNPSFPAELNDMIGEGEVCDFHHFVRVGDEGGLELDATWQDGLEKYGFPVNSNWSGETNTELASVPLELFEPEEDLIALKIRLVATLTHEQAERRSRYFALLSAWIASTPGVHG